MRIRLPWRLFISYALVVLTGAAVAYVTVRLLAPTLFDHQMSMLDAATRCRAWAPDPMARTGACARRSCPP